MVISNKYSSILTGVLIMTAGLFIAFVSGNPSDNIRYVVVACAFVGGVITMLNVFEHLGKKKVPKNEPVTVEYEVYETSYKYQLLIGSGLIAYAAFIVLYMDDVQSFLKATTFFLLLFGITEIIFSYQVLNFTDRPEWHAMLFKVIAGGIALLGAIVAMGTTLLDDNLALLISGISISLIGLTFILVSRYL